MTIRARLTLWYVGIMFVSLLAMVAFSYNEFVVEPRHRAHHRQRQEKPQEAEDRAGEEDQAFEGLDIILWCGLPAAVLAVGGGWWLMRKALAPVTSITRAAERVSERNLGEQLPRTGNHDELDRLTEVFNAMTARLETSFQRIREFTLHASHELKTPLTILHGEMETELQNTQLSAEQRERLFSQLDEVQRLSKIVDGLTLLTKADAGQVRLNLETIRLDELIQDAAEDAQILARISKVQVHLGVCEPVTIRGDRHRLRQLLLNLTDNAIKYNTEGGTVNVQLRRSGNSGVIVISYTGKGVPADVLPHVFDRFFRGDPSHNSAVDGCGLGLSIAKWIVTAHGGRIELDSPPGELTTATVCLPGVAVPLEAAPA